MLVFESEEFTDDDTFTKDFGIDMTKNLLVNSLRVLVGSGAEAFKKVGPAALCWTTSWVGSVWYGVLVAWTR